MPEHVDEKCIFCRIVAGQSPSAPVFEDDKVLAFMNLQQKNQGHTLVIPKDHYRNVYEIPEDLAAYVTRVAVKIARAVKVQFVAGGINLLQNNDPPAMQSVFHYHVHVIPRYQGDDLISLWKAPPSTPDELASLAVKLKAGL